MTISSRGALRGVNLFGVRLLLLAALVGVTSARAETAPGEPPVPTETSETSAPQSAPASAPAAAPTAAQESVGEPDAGTETPELTADMVYAVLVGEVAMQRDDPRMAFTHYLLAARLSRDPAMAELAARAGLSLRDPQAAVRATDLWLELEPDSPRARQIAAYAQIDVGDRAAALRSLRDLIRLASDTGQGYMQAAQMLTRVANPAERVAMMRDLVADDVEDAQAQYALAMLAAGATDVQSARAHAERAAALRPDWNEPRVFLVRLLVSEQRRDEAVAVLNGFLTAEPDDQELQLLLAQLYIEDKAYDEALAQFDQILKRGPGQPDVLFTAAVLALEVEALDKARDYLTRLRQTGARADDSAFLFGQVEELAGDSELALDWYEQVRGENATNARVRIAGIYAERGEVEQAREIMQQLRDQYPEEVSTLYLIEGELLREQDLTQQALEVYSDGLSVNPDDPDLLYARAMLAVGMDRVDLLEQDLRRILVSDPDHVDALNALGYTLADRTERLAEAQRFIERALQLRPDEPAILDSMGWLLFRQGDAEGAEPYLRQALDAVFDAEIAAHLGEVLWALDKRDEARAIWDRALAEDPKDEYLLRTIGRHRITQSGS
jgi:tetratricopeptide (TPR) repeat protein